jgi:hypothetical protein
MEILTVPIQHIRRQYFGRIIVGALLVVMLPLSSFADDSDIKAAFLFNMINFISWPPKALHKDTITIGLLGSGSLENSIKRLQNKSVQGRRIQVRHAVSQAELHGCQILVILPSERRYLSSLLLELRNDPVLTVSEIDGFSNQGGMLYLTVSDNHPAFKVNLKAVRTAGLDMSSHLLKLAQFVLR